MKPWSPGANGTKHTTLLHFPFSKSIPPRAFHEISSDWKQTLWLCLRGAGKKNATHRLLLNGLNLDQEPVTQGLQCFELGSNGSAALTVTHLREEEDEGTKARMGRTCTPPFVPLKPSNDAISSFETTTDPTCAAVTIAAIFRTRLERSATTGDGSETKIRGFGN